MAVIYGLVFNRDNRIFYVGQTYRDLAARFHEHYWNPKGRKSNLYGRIIGERYQGFDISPVVLEYCDYNTKDQRERHWIGGLPNLVNQHLLFRSAFSLSQEETEKVEAIRLSGDGGIPNWCGHIGILYFPYWEAWKVQILHWDNFYVLRGDGGPTCMEFWSYPGAFGHPRYHGDWYFSDGSKAVEARNRERERLDRTAAAQWRGFEWPQDFAIPEDGAEEDCYFRREVPLLSYEAEDYCNTVEAIEIGELVG